MEERVVVFPGDPVAIAEEFVAGPGTYEEDGNVYAATLGRLVLDSKEFLATVRPFTDQPAVLKAGDVVIGTIQSLRSSMAIVEARALASNPGRRLGCDTNGTLHISSVSDQYVENIEDAFHLGDIVRAEVTSVDPSLQLTTKAPVLGTLKSYCPRCRTPMSRRDRALACPECDWKETGKLAADYGEGKLLFLGPMPAQEPRERRERRDRPDRGGRGRFDGPPRGGRSEGPRDRPREARPAERGDDAGRRRRRRGGRRGRGREGEGG